MVSPRPRPFASGSRSTTARLAQPSVTYLTQSQTQFRSLRARAHPSRGSGRSLYRQAASTAGLAATRCPSGMAFSTASAAICAVTADKVQPR